MASSIAQQWQFGVPIINLCLNRNGDELAVALGDGSLRLLPASEDATLIKEMKLHTGVSLSLCADADPHAFLSGGDDGKVFIIDPTIDAPTPICDQPKVWIDHVASSAEGGYRAYSLGKKVCLLNDEGAVKWIDDLPSSVGGLAFSPNGKRLAASHYGGVILWWTNAALPEQTKLLWKGSHLGVVWQPDGKSLITAMQESALHGWRLADQRGMQMQGYAAKVRSFAFTERGRYLATSGSEQAICWPFFGGGPWDKEPLTLGGSDNRLVVSVAPHPKDGLVAVGYNDGMVILAPLDGRMEMLIHNPMSQDASIVGMTWNAEGTCLFVGLATGTLLLFTIKSVQSAAVRRP